LKLIKIGIILSKVINVSSLHSIEGVVSFINGAWRIRSQKCAQQFIIDENINPDINVYSDNKKINQIFMNILGNANKFTENGQIKVTATTQPVDENTISLITEISDTGVGISKSDLEKIFEPYYQGVLSEDVENLGAGLGLSLCKEIIGLYDGNISVSSEEGKGTTVHFSVNLNISK
jgi:signal transduction histidine kinase